MDSYDSSSSSGSRDYDTTSGYSPSNSLSNSKLPSSTVLSLVKSKQWSQVQRRCQIASPDEILQRDTTSRRGFHKTSIHYACSLHAPLPIIQCLVHHATTAAAGNTSKSATQEFDNQDSISTPIATILSMTERSMKYTPLHCACRYNASSQVVEFLMNQYPPALFQTDKHGWTPLHVACYFGSSFSSCSTIIAGDDSSIPNTTNDDDDVSMLVSTLLKNVPTPAKTNTATHPNVMTLMITSSSSNTSCKSQMTPLALACQSKNPSSFSIIQTLLDLYPQAASVILDGGWTPLHLAVWHNASVESIHSLVCAFPHACYCMTWSSGQSPMGMYWAHCYNDGRSGGDDGGENDRKKIVSLLLDPPSVTSCEAVVPSSPHHDSTGERLKQNHGSGLIHAYLSFPQYIPSLISYLLNAFSNDVHLRHENGLLPLHRVILEDKADIHVLMTILNSFPEATAIPYPTSPSTTINQHEQHCSSHRRENEEGRLPLIMAMTTQRYSSWHVLKQLVYCYPDAVRCFDGPTNLYPFMVAGSTICCGNLNTCYELLQCAPEVVEFCCSCY